MGSIENIITENIDVWSSAIKQRNTQGRGSSKRQELYGVQKLRELILELAVRGLLVPQDPNDEPALILLKETAKERELLVKDKKIKSLSEKIKIVDFEKPFSLPRSWCWAFFPEVCSYGVGKTPSTKNSTYWADSEKDGVHWASIADMEQYRTLNKTAKFVSQKAIENVFKYEPIKAGTLIMSFKLTLGKISRLGVDAYHNEAIISIFPFSQIDSNFIYRFLPARALAGNSKSAIKGSTLNSESLAALLIPVPPLKEQKRIVAKVDELMALCDQLEQQQENSIAAHEQLVETLLAALTQAADNESFEQAWSRIAANFGTLFTTENSIDQLKKTLLQLAVMGKLVPQDPNDEPAAVLVEEIFKTKIKLEETENLKTKAKEAIDAAEHYIDKPAAWEFVRLGNLAKFIDYRGRTPSKIKSGIPLITAKNIKYGFVSREPAEFISEEDYEEWMTRGFPRLKDVLFTTEAPLGNVALIDIEEKFALAQRAICFQLHEPLVAEYLVYLIMSKPFQEQLADNATGMTAKGIKASKLKEIVVPMPPIAEQKRIVAKVDQLFAICDQLKTKINSAQQTQLQLADAITSQAIQ